MITKGLNSILSWLADLVRDALGVIVPHPLVSLDQVRDLLVIDTLDGSALTDHLTDLEMDIVRARYEISASEKWLETYVHMFEVI